jgi:SAM-dependent methyltransferase
VRRDLYDRIGHGYTFTRHPDARIAHAIWRALGDARSVVNIGAGAGAYEPRDRTVLAVDPSAVMLAQRPPHAAPALIGTAEALPLADDSFDAAMVVLSDHHWSDRLQGLRELLRVARRRIVLFNADPADAERFWLTREYLPSFLELIPEAYRRPGHWAEEMAGELGRLQLEPVPIPHDCSDGFYGAYWRRPQSYLDQSVRDGISVFAHLPQGEVDNGLARLSDDLASGAWEHAHRDLIHRAELDLGYRIVVAELS